MKGIEAARGFWLLGALALALCLAGPLGAMAGETGSSDEYGGVALTNSILLDPFDPVPEIHFRDGCGDECRRHCDHDCEEHFRCHEDCRWQGWYCPHDCYDMHRPREGAYNIGWWRCADQCRDGDWWCDHDCYLEGWHCEHDCFVHEPCDRYCRERRDLPPREMLGEACGDICYGRLVHDYKESLAQHADQAHRYDDQSHWYFEHVINDHRGFFERLFDPHGHDGPPPVPPPPPPPPPAQGPSGPGYGPGPGAWSGYGPPPGAYGSPGTSPSGPPPSSPAPSGPPPSGPPH